MCDMMLVSRAIIQSACPGLGRSTLRPLSLSVIRGNHAFGLTELAHQQSSRAHQLSCMFFHVPVPYDRIPSAQSKDSKASMLIEEMVLKARCSCDAGYGGVVAASDP